MRRFKVEENLSVIIRLLKVVGTWPINSPPISYKLRGCTTVALVIIGILLTTENILKFVNIQIVCFAICCFLVSVNTMIKYIFIFVKKKNLLVLLRMLNHSVLSLHENHLYEFLEKKATMVRFFQYTYLLSGVGTSMLILASPIFNKRSIPLPFFVDIEGQGFLVFGLAWLVEICGFIIICVSICSFDGLIFFFIAMAGAELKILQEKIMEAGYLNSKDEQVQYNSDERVNVLLKKCIIQHVAIERYVSSIQTSFSNVFLSQLAISLGAICFVGFTLILVPITSFEFWLSVLFFGAVTCELILFCVPGNEIILQSEKILDACYMSQWVNCGPSVRKTLFIIMERAKRPLILTAGDFLSLSLDTLVSVLKCAFSYFTVLKRLYGDSMEI